MFKHITASVCQELSLHLYVFTSNLKCPVHYGFAEEHTLVTVYRK